MTEMICIVCPKGCRLKVDENNGFAVSGNACERGETYGRQELQNPTRTLTSTVRVTGGQLSRCPVRTSEPIPKRLIFEAMEQVNALSVQAPVHIGQVLISNLLDTGADLIVTREIE